MVNHALLLQDLMKESLILPEYDHLIIDEAHHLEKVTTSSLAITFSPSSFLRPFEKLGKADNSLITTCNQIITRGEIFFGILGIFTEKHADAMELQYSYLIKDEALNSMEWKKVQESVTTLHQLTGELLKELNEYSNDEEETLRDVRSLTFDIQQRHNDLKTVFLSENWKNRIQWTYKTYEGTQCLKSAPLNVGVDLQTQLFNAKKSVILTSATLRTENSFDFIRGQLSLDSSIEAVALPSHFDYPDQVKIIIPEDLPAPATEGYFKACSNIIGDIIKANSGRALILFTSKKRSPRPTWLLPPTSKKTDTTSSHKVSPAERGKSWNSLKRSPKPPLFSEPPASGRASTFRATSLPAWPCKNSRSTHPMIPSSIHEGSSTTTPLANISSLWPFFASNRVLDGLSAPVKTKAP